jgi:hypothetical protein
MAIQDILRWSSGNGWIILSGGTSAGGEVRAQALRRINAGGGVAYLGFDEASGDETLDDMEDLGAPTGYLVNIVAEDDLTIREQLEEASLIMLDDSVSAEAWRDTLPGAAADGILAALENGAVILAEGRGAAALGTYMVDASGQLTRGLGWLEHLLILPEVTQIGNSDAARETLEQEADAIVLGIGQESAIALGPEGLMEVLGSGQVAIGLGRAYQTP